MQLKTHFICTLNVFFNKKIFETDNIMLTINEILYIIVIVNCFKNDSYNMKNENCNKLSWRDININLANCKII